MYSFLKKTSLFPWVKANSVLLLNAASLVSTTAVTSVLGFAYWWVAARLFPPDAVGLASAAISAMTLLGTVCTLGLGTLLIGELPRQPGKAVSLIGAALLLVLGVGGGVGGFFALLSPFVSESFLALRANGGVIVFFALGVGLTAVTLVLDQSLIGLLQGKLQLGRNTLFALAKLIALLLVGLLLWQKSWFALYATWSVGSLFSLLALADYVLRKVRIWRREHWPQWNLLRKLGPSALQHYALNMILQIPDKALPILVTAVLSVTANAGFYVASMLASFVYVGSSALTTVLYATMSADPSALVQRSRLTLGIGLLVCSVASIILFLGARPLLLLFGHAYAEQATWSLRLLGLAAFPLIIKNHYIALCRIEQRIAPTLLPLTICCALELIASATGAHVGGLVGLSLGWLLALLVEAVFMFRPVYMMVRPQWPRLKEGLS